MDGSPWALEENRTLAVLVPPSEWPAVTTTEQQLDLTVFQRFASNRRVNDAAFIGLIAAYSLLIVIGTLGNSLVVYVVARQPAMRTARNVFVVNLAVSDLLLCLITMPLTLMEILSNTWPLGNSPVSCKMVGSLQAVSIFVSTLSITAIALDRYQLIVYPTKRSFQLTGALLALAAIWVVGVILALPLFIVRTLQHFDIPAGIKSPIQSIDYCLEDWASEKGRSFYSAGSILVQYALPIVTVSVAHARICNKLRFRMASMQQRQQQHHQPSIASTAGSVVVGGSVTSNVKPSDAESRKAAREEQLRKTNLLLMAIAIIFTICWLPMNIFNVVVDTWNVFGDDTETMLIVYAVCHMVGMSSACANPLLYGWLNDNFRKEFQKIGDSFRRQNRGNELTKRSSLAAATATGAAAATTEALGSVKEFNRHKRMTAIVRVDDDHHAGAVASTSNGNNVTTSVILTSSPAEITVTAVTHAANPGSPKSVTTRSNHQSSSVTQEL